MWTVEGVKAREYRPTKIKDKDFSLRNNQEMYGMTCAKKCGIGEKEKQKEEK